MQHNIDRTGKLAQAAARHGPHAPADSVALDRPTQDFSHGKADARPSFIVTHTIESRYIP